MSPVVLVCIANYNGIDLIDACIDSVRGQDCGFAVEIIVHDDASTDGSVEYIRARHPAVHLIESTENVGFCVANNRMAAAARGEYLLLLNNDATLLPDALSVLMGEAKRLTSPAILTLPQYDAETGEVLDIGSRLDPFLNPVPNLDPKRNDVGTVAGACLWIDKALWDELEGFPEWFGSIGEDLYLCCRARLAGYPVRALGVSGYRHHVGQSFGGGKAREGKLATTFRRRALSERNKTFVLVLTYPTPLLQLLLPLHLALLAAEGAALTLARADRRVWQQIYAACFAELWRTRARLQALRHQIQRARIVDRRQFFAPFRALPHKLRLVLRHGLPAMH